MGLQMLVFCATFRVVLGPIGPPLQMRDVMLHALAWHGRYSYMMIAQPKHSIPNFSRILGIWSSDKVGRTFLWWGRPSMRPSR